MKHFSAGECCMRYARSNMRSNLFFWYGSSLHQVPSEKMGLARELKSGFGVAESDFPKMFPSVPAMLDFWWSSRDEPLFVPNLPRLPAFTQSYRFQERGLAVGLPLYRTELLMKVHSTYADTVRDPDILEEYEFDTKWGKPLIEPEITFIDRKLERPKAPWRDTNRLFWEEQVTFDF